MSEFWQHALIAGAVIVAAWLLAKLVDRRIARRDLSPEAVTRYRVLRHAVFATIVFVGVISALLVIPQVRAVAGGLLASSAVLALVIGFASQRTIGNAVAGILITFTWLRTNEDDRVVVPNEKLASGTIRNLTIRSGGAFAEVTARVPISVDL